MNQKESAKTFMNWKKPFGLYVVFNKIYQRFDPLTANIFNLNFHPLEVVSSWRDPQLQVSENYSNIIFDKMEVNCFQILLIDVTFYL